MMKNLFAAVAILFAGALNAQWDTLNTGVNYRLNSIDANEPNQIGVVAVGFNPTTDSGGYGALLISGDNGNTWWEQIEAFAPNLELRDIDFTNNQRAWIVGDSGMVVLRTVWFLTYTSGGYISPYDLHCGYTINDSTFYCAGEHGVAYRTFDYGMSWDTLSSGTTETINDIYFTNTANGWIVGDGGVLSVTSDSGSTWTPVQQLQWGFTNLNGFAYQGSSGFNPYLVGDAGVAQFSINGGAQWNYFASGTAQNINTIRFGTTNSGLMVGNGGYIVRTDNGGWTWFQDPSTENVNFFDVAFAGDTTAFICGDSGVVLRSNTNISSVQTHEIRSFAAGAYPNPTNGALNLQLLLPVESDITIDILNITGEIIATEYHENVSTGNSTLPLDMQSVAAGFYFVRISNGFSAVTMRVVKQ